MAIFNLSAIFDLLILKKIGETESKFHLNECFEVFAFAGVLVFLQPHKSAINICL